MSFFSSRSSLRPLLKKRCGTRRGPFLRHLLLEPLEDRTLLATFIVDNVNNSGEGSLRQAMADANDNAGLDIILFNIPGAGVHTITPNFSLPDITDPVIINATTQPGWTPSTPMIELDGHLSGDSNGLHFQVGGNTIQGLVIHSFKFDGIVLAEPSSSTPSGGSTVQLNFLGTDATGLVPKPNHIGLHLVGSPNNVIKQNLISGNAASGIEIDFSTSTGNLLTANLIGTNISGLAPLGNGLNGVALVAPNIPLLRQGNDDVRGYASGNIVGGSILGDGNVISGNQQAGVYIFRGSQNKLLGNLIGLGADGITPVPNGTDPAVNPPFGKDGVWIEEGNDNSIGGFDVAETNTISANKGNGIRISAVHKTALRNLVIGNLIGTDKDQNSGPGLGNEFSGVDIRNESADDAATVLVSNNVIGGDDDDDGNTDEIVGARNIIGGNGQDGVRIIGHQTANNVVQGNLIGINEDDQIIANVRHGISLDMFNDQAPDTSLNLIGGATPGAGNTISGNGADGVAITRGARGRLMRNVIGLTRDETEPRGNVGHGIEINNSAGSKIGDLDGPPGELTVYGNTISGNTGNGVVIFGSKGGNILIGNYIGTNEQGDDLGNGVDGIRVDNAAFNSIGGAESSEENIISNNAVFGIRIVGADSNRNLVTFNTIVENLDSGIGVNEATETLISHNRISGNPNLGVILQGASDTEIKNNVIGTDETGMTEQPNLIGVFVLDSSGTVIGGDDFESAGNVISGNVDTGILLKGSGTVDTLISSNIIGLDFSGNAKLANEDGILIVAGDSGAPSGNHIVGNLVAGNRNSGITIQSASNNTVQANLIGTNSTDMALLGNGTDGVVLDNASGNLIGGSAEGENNVISGNVRAGVHILNPGAIENSILGNRIGSGVDGQSELGNDIGVYLQGGASHNLIQNNIIGGNHGLVGAGVALVVAGPSNTLKDNAIGTAFGDDTVTAPNDIGISIADTSGTIIGGPSFEDGGNVIGRNRIGIQVAGEMSIDTQITGNVIDRNIEDGLIIEGQSGSSTGPSQTMVQGNSITRNGRSGIALSNNASNNTIEQNFIGTNANSDIDFGNDIGVYLLAGASQNLIQNNVIGGQKGLVGAGIFIVAAGVNTVKDNVIGANRNLSVTLPNSVGIWINDTAGTIVGGESFENGGNLIQSNRIGVSILGQEAIGTQITGNIIHRNAEEGIVIEGSAVNSVGPSKTMVRGNSITRNGLSGIRISDFASKNFVQGNLIGIDASGLFDQSNVGEGVLIDNASDNAIGGPSATAGNVIQNNGKAGVFIKSGTGNAILHNMIFNNGGLGIDLGTEGINLNDRNKDGDTGANNLQNYPELTIATVGESRRILGTLKSAASSVFILEFFAAGTKLDDTDPSQHGESPLLLNTVGVITNASGIASFDVELPAGPVTVGHFITATATDANGNTSEFAKNIRVEVDNDGDGIPDNMEDGGPNAGDANQDGIPDRQQSNVASFRAVNNEFMTLAAPAGLTFTQVSPLENPSPDDAPAASFDLGLFGFQLSGVTPGGFVEVDLILPAHRSPQSYLRYGPTPDDASPHWYNWVYNNFTGAEINGNRITLHFIDGQLGDDDLVANGTILDPGGPAFPPRFTVSTTDDSGAGSLRQAILDANNHPGPDVIDFQIESGVQTIIPLSTLPALTDAVTIDGTTQPGFAGSPIIEIDGKSAPGSGLTIAASSVTIRGLVINRFTDYGIQTVQLGNQQPVAFRIEGNYLGTDVTGMLPQGNRWGVGVNSGNGVIGGTTADARNVISANTVDGVLIGVSFSVAVKGNYIGVAADGVSPLGNLEDGILIPANGASNVVIGGLEPGAGNIIAFNEVAGVENWRAGSGNSILSNRIYSNGILGINVNPGVAADLNDNGLNDGTGGNPQNYPVLSSAMSSAGMTTISGYLQSRPNRTYLLQFFSNETVTTSGFGQGETLLGSASVTTDASGHADFTATFNVSTPNRRLITATSTESGNTSEFSVRLAVGDVLENVYTVNSVDDVDDGIADSTHTSLREAIHAANNHPGPDTIRFDIGSGVQTIAPLTPLPAIIDPIVIDGTTQPGFVGTPVIQLVGTSVEREKFASGTPISLHLTGLGVFTSDSTIRGLVINDFYEFGADSSIWGGRPLAVFGDDNVIAGNFIGTDVTGTIARRTLNETLVDGNGNRIGGTTVLDRNLFAAGQEGGLRVTGMANVIQGNFVGTDSTGTKALPNGRGFAVGSVAVRVSGANTFGGTAPGAGNLVSGNLGDAISITGADGSVVQGNLIGTDITGTKMLGNGGGGSGITAQASGQAPLLIGGSDPAARNIISNNSFGIIIGGTGVVVQGNYIGTDITGTVDFGNSIDGVFMSGTGHLIGGTAPGAGNLISGNNRTGIVLLNPGGSNITSGNAIQGNRIGTMADGTSALGNGTNGIAVAENFALSTSGTGPIDNLIGGTDNGAGNIIGFNGQTGVNILAGQRIGILSNSIFFNGSLGIDLNGDGSTPNDAGDPDNGDNALQNFPVISAAVTDGSKTAISGTLNSAPNAVFIIQVFFSPDADDSGFGEGETLLGTHYVITDASGNGAFTFVFPLAVPVGQRITATATDLLNHTSEFSLSLALSGGIVPPNQPPVAHAGGPYTINEGDSLVFFSPSDDPDGDPINLSWDINGDGDFGDASGAAPTLNWDQLRALGIINGPSSFDVSVRVDDGQGHLVTSSPTKLNVLNVKPVADAGPTTRSVFEGSPIDFTGTFTDPGTADTHTLRWHVTSNNGQVIADGSEANFNFVPFDNGTYTVTFTVTDSDQESGMAVVNVIVSNANPLAQFIGLPAKGTAGVPIHLTSSISDPSSVDEAAGLTINWFASLTPDYDVEFSATTPDFSFTPTEPGIWDVALIVRDKDFGRTVSQIFLEVLPLDTTSPVPIISGPSSPTLEQSFDVTIHFGEQVNGFDSSDIQLTNGSLADFTDNAGGSYTATVTGIIGTTLTVRIPAGTATDVEGNPNVSAQYSVDVVAPSLDFGDAPSAYPVTMDRNGASHIAGLLRLGNAIDTEADGLPSPDADGDGSDEDGLQFVTTLLTGLAQTASSVLVEASDTGMLDAWIDFNGDGDWDDVDERVITSFVVSAGRNIVPLSVVAGASAGTSFARFRLSTGGTPLPTGVASDGEVEDYAITLVSGNADSLVEVLMVEPRIEIRSMQDATILASPTVERFRAPQSNVGQLRVVGTTQDDVVAIKLTSLVIPNVGLHLDGAAGNNRIELTGDGTSFDFSTAGRTFVDFNRIDLSSTDATAITLNAAVVKQMSPVHNRIEILTAVGDQIHVNESSRWRMTNPVIVGGSFRVTATHVAGDGEMIEAALPHPWQNFLRTSDVNNDGFVTSLDALAIINELGRRLYIQNLDGDLPGAKTVAHWPGIYYDQNGDDRATALDALRVINEMARISDGDAGERVPGIAQEAFVVQEEVDIQEEVVDRIADSNSVQKIVSISIPASPTTRETGASLNSDTVDIVFSDLTVAELSQVGVL